MINYWNEESDGANSNVEMIYSTPSEFYKSQ